MTSTAISQADSPQRVSSPFRPPEVEDSQPREQLSETPRSTEPPSVGFLPAGFELREMTGYEEEYLEVHLTDSNTAELVNQILARCLVAPGADPSTALQAVRDLPVAHRDAALLELRRRSLGPCISSEVTCPSCDELNRTDFDLTEIPLELTAPPKTIEHCLSDGRRAVLRLPNAGDQADLLAAGIDSMAERRTWMLGRVLCQLADNHGPFNGNQARSLTTRIRRELEAALEEAVPDLDLSMGVVCQSCGHEFSSAFDVAGFFFSSSGGAL